MPAELDAQLVGDGAHLIIIGSTEAASVDLRVCSPDAVRSVALRPRLDIAPKVTPRLAAVVVLQSLVATRVGERALRQGNIGRMTGLVRENADDGSIFKPSLEPPRVFPMRKFDKALHGFWLQKVHPAARPKRVAPDERTVRRARKRELLEPEARILGGHAPAAAAARPVVLVIEPELHAAPFDLLGKGRGTLPEFLAQIL